MFLYFYFFFPLSQFSDLMAGNAMIRDTCSQSETVSRCRGWKMFCRWETGLCEVSFVPQTTVRSRGGSESRECKSQAGCCGENQATQV